ncbi:MAG: 6-phospho-beta-glucosidase [Acidobacteriota bacterium]|nr:6-phospho-beta-glucosidase [Acidobacteriota bacterium]
MRNVAVIGGGGLRTPLLIHGIAQAQSTLQIGELRLYDLDPARAEIMAGLGREIARSLGAGIRITTRSTVADAVDGAEFVLSSLRVGGMAARARDERMSVEHGLAGQETTGPGGLAMALRTVPVALEHARVIEEVAPHAWYINFTNPAGLITQALTQHTNLKVIGICDTPAELFHRIAAALSEPPERVFCDYAGLNHLGWVRRVLVGDRDVTGEILGNEQIVRSLYSADLFDPALIRTLGLLPTEYLFFYYSQRKAYRNQLKAGATRGAELERMNAALFAGMENQDAPTALVTYRDYLMRRNASYMKLEGEAGSAFPSNASRAEPEDPFTLATGYHRIAVQVMTGLVSQDPGTVVVNVPNHGAIEDLEPDDVVEVPCRIDSDGPTPLKTGRLPDSVRGLILSVKAYERTAIRAAIARSGELAQLAMLECPIIGQWEMAKELREALGKSDPGLFET